MLSPFCAFRFVFLARSRSFNHLKRSEEDFHFATGLLVCFGYGVIGSALGL
jgi:hypothetical protein